MNADMRIQKILRKNEPTIFWLSYAKIRRGLDKILWYGKLYVERGEEIRFPSREYEGWFGGPKKRAKRRFETRTVNPTRKCSIATR